MSIDLGDASRFSQAVDTLVEVMGADWLSARIHANEALTGTDLLDEGSRLLRALSEYPAMLEAIHARRPPPDASAFLFLGMTSLVVFESKKSSGGERFCRKLRDLARADRFSAFFDTLFEGESALYWRDQMRAGSIEFPKESHPDFWASLTLANVGFRIPNECKRIAPRDPREIQREALTSRIEEELRTLWVTSGALKVIVWLHAPDDKISEVALLDGLRSAVAGAEKTPGEWFTTGAVDGSFQASVALAAAEGQWAEREIKIEDVPAVGPLRTCVETRYLGKRQDPTRLKYVLSVRSDVLPDRIGAFERNLGKAVRQLRMNDAAVGGVINVRIRPPRALGDLFEADAIVRRVLREPSAGHVALVILYWDEGERQEGPWQNATGHPEREVTATYYLQAHFVAGRPSPIDFRSIDSASRRFPAHSGLMMRDPETGSLGPIDQPVASNAAPDGYEVHDDAATVLISLREDFPANIQRIAISRITKGSRTFVPFFDDSMHVRVLEFEGSEPVRLATIDMRAWKGERELLFHLRWSTDGWTLGSSGPRTRGEVIANAVGIRRAFL